MSSIDDTIERYKSVCAAEKVTINPYIMKILNKEKEDTVIESKGVMHLYLAGNDRLLTDTKLTDHDVLIMYKCLQNNLYVVSIDLRYNALTDKGAHTIATLLTETAALSHLDLMCNDIEEEGAKHIAAALQKNETLKYLRMTGNKIGNKGGMYFAQMLQINKRLEALDLGDTDQKTESVIALATILNYNNTLRALNVNRPILFSHQEETTVHYANMLKVNKSLKELHLIKHDLRDFGATRLAEKLMDNFTLTYLNLSCNRITRDGAKELASLLKKNTCLKVLDLSYNRLENDGAIHIAEALATYNTNLETLVVTTNQIHGRGLCALADAMKMNSTLTHIYIWGNELEESACIAFAKLMEFGRLEQKNTDVEPYITDGVTYLAELFHGIRRFYYWGQYGDKQQREEATVSVVVQPVS